jgi:hypothetical protein
MSHSRDFALNSSGHRELAENAFVLNDRACLQKMHCKRNYDPQIGVQEICSKMNSTFVRCGSEKASPVISSRATETVARAQAI